MNICRNNCDGLSNITLTGEWPYCDKVFITNYGNGTQNRAIFVFNSTFREISCLSISNFSYFYDFTESPINTLRKESFEAEKFGGAAIEVRNSSIVVRNVTFSKNAAYVGGAMSAFAATIRLELCKFEDNIAYGFGGAIGAFYSDIIVEGSRFLSNRALTFTASTLLQYSSFGGAIYVSNSIEQSFLPNQQLILRRTSFLNNLAQRGGGAVFMDSVIPANHSFQAYECEFTNNTVNGEITCLSTASCNPRGGALYLNVLSVSLIESKFSRNVVLSSASRTQQEVVLLSITLALILFQ